MTPEEQRIAIAEACGWKPCGWRPIHSTDKNTDLALGGTENWWRNANENTVARLPELPDYLNDLNAMYEAFKSLGRHWEICQVGDGYVCRIQFGPQNKDVVVAGLELLPVMAEAFLRTIGKWKEEA